MFKNKKYCNLCNIEIGKLDKTFCRDCKKIREHIRDNGLNSILQIIRSSHKCSVASAPPPSAPPYRLE